MFTRALFVSFRSGYSLRSHLVRAKVFPLIREKGSSCCGKSRCETCFNIQETIFKILSQKKFIGHHFDFDSKYVIYLISCKLCSLQFVGQTFDRFRRRWNNYKFLQRILSEDGHAKQNYFHQPFLSEDYNGLLENCEIKLIDKTDPSDAARREFFCMRKLKTLVPLGINFSECVLL